MVVYVNAARRRRLSRESVIPEHDPRSERSDPGEELPPGLLCAYGVQLFTALRCSESGVYSTSSMRPM